MPPTPPGGGTAKVALVTVTSGDEGELLQVLGERVNEVGGRRIRRRPWPAEPAPDEAPPDRSGHQRWAWSMSRSGDFRGERT